MFNSNLDVLIDVARSYHELGLTQQEIAEGLNISRSQVSRYLTEAKDLGIIQTRIIDPRGQANNIEDALKNHFPNLIEAVVIPWLGSTAETLRMSLGRACAQFLSGKITAGQKLCIGSGSTLLQVVRSLRSCGEENINVIQATGSIGHEALNIDFNEMTRTAATALGARAFYINAPAILGSGTSKELIAANQTIRESLEMARSANIYLVGVGSFRNDQVHVLAGLIPQPEMKILKAGPAVGDICGRFFSIDGQECKTTFDERVVGIELMDMRNAPLSIGVAGGKEKITALLGALRNKCLNVLVTDEQTAKAIIDLDHNTRKKGVIR